MAISARAARRPVRPIMDTAIAVVFGIAGQVELRVPNQQGFHGTAPLWINSLLAVLVIAPLPWRRHAPLTVVCLVGAGMGLPRLVVENSVLFWGGLVPFVFALYSASRHAAAPRDRLALLIPVAVIVLLSMTVAGFEAPDDFLFSTIVFGAAWLAGQGIRRWHRDSTRLAAALRELEGTQHLRAQAAVTQERARIARELHDIIAHSMSVMVLQASSARLELHAEQHTARESLQAVEVTGRQALIEMRRLLGVLRTDHDLVLTPQPGLDDLDALVSQMNQAGLTVSAQVSGHPVALAPAQGLSAYRIVQEALTNVLTHAGPTRAEVRLTYRPTELELSITNPTNGQRKHHRGGGHGLIGMRERAALFGGHLQAGPSADGTFAVQVLLPLTPPGS